jgi:Trk-type K+ transport system membrane component
VKELDPLVFVAVFQEMLGPMLWLMLGLAVLGVTAFVALLAREKGIVARRLVRAELIGLFGGVLALVSDVTRTLTQIQGLSLVLYGALLVVIIAFLPNGLIDLFSRLGKRKRSKAGKEGA